VKFTEEIMTFQHGDNCMRQEWKVVDARSGRPSTVTCVEIKEHI
jgi:hypothetical protein